MKFRYISLACLLLATAISCTKLNQQLEDGFSQTPASSSGGVDVNALLNGNYNDMNGLMHAQDQLFSLMETTSDEALIPTRGGDWDDNGVWRVLHAHTWNPLHAQIRTVFNGLGQLESDALSTAAQTNDPEKRAEALFLRSVAQFYFLDLYGQVPYRKIEEYNALTPAPVLRGQEAIDTLVNTLTSIIPQLSDANTPYSASPDAARFLLMKVYLNKAAWLATAKNAVVTPTDFQDADMQQVITLGNQIINSGKYSLNQKYFDNFGPQNITLGKGEEILAWPNNGSASTAVQGRGSGGINARWMMTLHYNSWDKEGIYGSAGWNGFTTVADFYNTFDANDQRVGNQPYPGVTDQSGLKPGFLVGQQYNEAGEPEKDRQGNPLAFTPDVNLIEKEKNRLEIAGIRVIKYPPDYSAYNGGTQRNQLQIFRYADVLLMVAEAKLRASAPDQAGALGLINQIRTIRGTAPWTAVTLVNEGNVADPNTLLAERGREMYWESWRRQDLIRFGVYLKPWALKEADKDMTNLLFPIAPEQLIANPNLQQNPGY